MKTISRILICLLLLACIIKIDAQINETKYNIVIQADDKTVSDAILKQSTDVLKKRLIDYGYTGPEIKIIPGKSQLNISVYSQNAQEFPELLVKTKGSIAFYETYSRESLNSIFNDNKSIQALLNRVGAETSNTNGIACLDQDKIAETIQQLKEAEKNNKCRFAWSFEPENSKTCLYALKINSDQSLTLKASDIKRTKVSVDVTTGHNQIEIEFNEEAKTKWAMLTSKNLNNPLAVTIDNKVYFAPILRSKIESGKCVISGDFTVQQVKLFSAISNSGELPIIFTLIK